MNVIPCLGHQQLWLSRLGVRGREAARQAGGAREVEEVEGEVNVLQRRRGVQGVQLAIRLDLGPFDLMFDCLSQAPSSDNFQRTC
jgi:hypothetical protein